MDETREKVHRVVRFRLFLPAFDAVFYGSCRGSARCVVIHRERFRIMHPRMQRGSTDSSGNFIFRLHISVALRQKESVCNEEIDRT
jgi:hypothetical protein